LTIQPSFIYHEFRNSGEKSELKFKTVFILFSFIIILFLIFVFIFPVLFIDPGYTGAFWRILGPPAVILFLVLLGMNVFYFRNRRLFYLLEREDWPALIQYLEDRILKRRHYYAPLVRLLANTYLVLSDYRSVLSLENRIAVADRNIVNANAIIFGTARILAKDYEGAARFFEEKAGKVKSGNAEWIRWYYGFARLLNRWFSQAADRFAEMAKEANDAVLTGLSSYLLASNLARALPGRGLELMAAAMDGRKRVRAALPTQAAWNRETGKIRSEVYAAVLSKYLDETSEWLYIRDDLT
jgi:hypothetical protein